MECAAAAAAFRSVGRVAAFKRVRMAAGGGGGGGALVPYARALALQESLVRARRRAADDDRRQTAASAAAAAAEGPLASGLSGDGGPSTASSSSSTASHGRGSNATAATPATPASLPRAHLDILLLLEHAPVYTAGRRLRNADDTAAEADRLRRATGADFFETMRGGQLTFHGPGQLVGYPIVHLRELQIGVREYVSKLESTLIRTCAHFGIQAGITGDTGVWVDDRKIAALGVHVSRYITSHGFALNCNTDLSWYDHIVACGLPDKRATSLTKELMLRQRATMTTTTTTTTTGAPEAVTVDDAAPVVVEMFRDVFGLAEVRALEDVDPALADLIDRAVAAPGGSGAVDDVV